MSVTARMLRMICRVLKNNDYLLLLEHTVAWKPTGMDEEMLFEDSRDQVLYEAK